MLASFNMLPGSKNESKGLLLPALPFSETDSNEKGSFVNAELVLEAIDFSGTKGAGGLANVGAAIFVGTLTLLRGFTSPLVFSSCFLAAVGGGLTLKLNFVFVFDPVSKTVSCPCVLVKELETSAFLWLGLD